MVDRDDVLESPEEDATGPAPVNEDLQNARRAMWFVFFTPLWWLFGMQLADFAFHAFPTFPKYSWYQGFLSGTWILFTLLLPFGAAANGFVATKALRESDDRRGLRMAQISGVLGVIFMIISILLAIGLVLG